MPLHAEKYLKHRESLLKDRALWEPVWQEISTFEFPRRLFTLGLRQPGAKQNNEMVDSTAGFAGEVLAASLLSGLTNPAQKWAGLRLTDEEEMKNNDTRRVLELATLRLLNAFKLSNLTTELGELYLDLAFLGIGVVFLGEKEKGRELIANFRGFRFQAFPVGSFVITEDGFGTVNGIYLSITMTHEAAALRWGAEKLSSTAREVLSKTPNKPLEIIHGVVDKELAPDAKTKLPWVSLWIEIKKKHVIEEGGFDEFPYLVPRWQKTSGETYGRGPGYTALPDVRSLNKLVELKLKALALTTGPPQKAKLNSILGAVDFAPFGLTMMRNPQTDMVPLELRADLRSATEESNEWRGSIRRTFFVEELLQLLARETPAMTATEVQVKLQLLQQILGPAFNRLNNELLKPLVKRGLNIMRRAGAMPELADLDDDEMQIEFEGPLARGQRGQELLAIERTLAVGQNLFTIDQTIVHSFNTPEILRLTQEISGAPATMLREDEDRDARVAQEKENQARAAAVEQLARGSEAAKNIAPLVTATQKGSSANR